MTKLFITRLLCGNLHPFLFLQSGEYFGIIFADLLRCKLLAIEHYSGGVFDASHLHKSKTINNAGLINKNQMKWLLCKQVLTFASHFRLHGEFVYCSA